MLVSIIADESCGGAAPFGARSPQPRHQHTKQPPTQCVQAATRRHHSDNEGVDVSDGQKATDREAGLD